ncbi:MAG: GntR family transcriptional regulator [Lachnospiraceae bacterium]|nr:GntR family transcriptional regulator [Lachnospiraceae bacterium]
MEEKNLKYQELIQYINNLIAEGALKPGDKLFSENKLADMFDISRQTVRHAIGILEEEGKVTRIRGSGTYISDRRSLNLEKRNRIAVVTTYVESYIFPKTIQGIEKVLFEKGYSVQIAFTNNTVERERNVLEDIISREDVAGVIVEGTKSGLPNPNIALYKKLQEKKIPILFINTFYPEIEAPHVSLNDVEAAKKAVNYLIEKGHTQIGAIMKLDDGQGRLRYLGYIQAMEAAGLPISDSRMVWIDTDDSKQLSLCMDKILSRVEKCTALLCYNDQIAYQLVHLLKERGIDVPGRLSLIGIDDSDLARMCEVPITSLPHPKENLGAKAAENLLALIENHKYNATYEFDTRVVERETVTQTEQE